jgi:hypothetical protein
MVSKVNLVDLYSSAYLIIKHLEPQLEVKNGKVIFSFEGSDEVYRLLNEFNSDVPVPVSQFVAAVKTLRGRMLSLKERSNGNHEGGRAHVG